MLPLRAATTLIVATLLMSACATSPTGRTQLQLVSDEQMTAMGVQAFEEIKAETPVSDDPRIREYVQCVSSALTRTLDDGGDWEVQVFADESVNAFALPGRKIGIFTGLLEVAENQDQLAAVIGHEIAHVLAEHSNARVSATYATSAGLQVLEALIAGRASAATREQAMGLLGVGAQYGVLMPYGRGQESEADILGLDIMAKAGFRPEASIELWRNMDEAGGPNPPELLSTHPSSSTRMEALSEKMPQAQQLYEQARASGRTPDCTL
ncbi:M48 family metallopeptidase [Gilvimarinus sp. F26214L]|uniref:M48 family metallopeptidase n=1 Tax=Gilvimarinus sp. DZF01 TaxID=3461371 RepID=UPI004045940E